MSNWEYLILLLLPLAVASGWFAARLDTRHARRGSGRRLTSDYFRGVNFLLDEQPDKAIEVFTGMVEVSSDTIETHLALGSLFRRRGEVERAIRIHQNLMARPNLDDSQRTLAVYELAKDYQKAGLLDRAEDLFRELTEISDHSEQALRALMHIYEQEKDWDQALAIGQQLTSRFGKSLGPVMAQYACEIAERRLKASDGEAARRHLADALKMDPRCARASILLGRQAMSAGRYRQAIDHWHRIWDQERYLLDEVIDEMALAYRKLGDESGLRNYLELATAEFPSARLLRILASLVEMESGREAAWETIAERVRRQPSLQGFRELMSLPTSEHNGSARIDIGAIREILSRLAEGGRDYLCQSCGFQGKSLHWQCPACNEWLSVRPGVVMPERGKGVRHLPVTHRAERDGDRIRRA